MGAEVETGGRSSNNRGQQKLNFFGKFRVVTTVLCDINATPIGCSDDIIKDSVDSIHSISPIKTTNLNCTGVFPAVDSELTSVEYSPQLPK